LTRRSYGTPIAPGGNTRRRIALWAARDTAPLYELKREQVHDRRGLACRESIGYNSRMNPLETYLKELRDIRYDDNKTMTWVT
jgi:hypothetical protein